jgi:hypothetical protein
VKDSVKRLQKWGFVANIAATGDYGVHICCKAGGLADSRPGDDAVSSAGVDFGLTLGKADLRVNH